MFSKKIQSISDNLNNYSTLAKNFSYLTLLEVFNFVFPLISYPYLIRILGAELFGTTVFAKSIVAYFSIIINYGFEISATKDVSVSRNDINKLSEIVSSVYIVKFLLFFFSFLIYALVVISFQEKFKYTTLFIFSFGICFYELLFPHYFYVGIEKMKYITILTVVSNALFTLLVFVIINNPNDFIYVPLLTSIGYLITGIISIFILVKKEHIRLYIPSTYLLKKQIFEGFSLFISRVSAKIYSNLTAVIIGTTLNMTYVAYYDIANKITSIAKMPISILSTTVYPHIAKTRNIGFVKKLRTLTISCMVGMYILVVLFSKIAVVILGGQEMQPAIPVLVILSFSIIPIAMSNLHGTQILAAFGYAKTMARAMMYTAIAYLICLGGILLFKAENLYVLTVLAVAVEIFLALLEWYYCKLKKLI